MIRYKVREWALLRTDINIADIYAVDVLQLLVILSMQPNRCNLCRQFLKLRSSLPNHRPTYMLNTVYLMYLNMALGYCEVFG